MPYPSQTGPFLNSGAFYDQPFSGNASHHGDLNFDDWVRQKRAVFWSSDPRIMAVVNDCLQNAWGLKITQTQTIVPCDLRKSHASSQVFNMVWLRFQLLTCISRLLVISTHTHSWCYKGCVFIDIFINQWLRIQLILISTDGVSWGMWGSWV